MTLWDGPKLGEEAGPLYPCADQSLTMGAEVAIASASDSHWPTLLAAGGTGLGPKFGQGGHSRCTTASL